MKSIFNRREFVWQASAGVVGGLVAGALPGGGRSLGDEHDPETKRLVLLGLNAMARAHLLCEETGMPAAGRSRIEQLFDLNWAKSPLCQPFPQEEPNPEAVKRIGEALMEGRGALREVGHNAIFAMLAIRGFRLLPSAATPQRIDGVCKLVRAMKPWHDDVKPVPDAAVPSFKDEAAASAFVLREASAAVDRWKGFGQGFTGHMLTFGQALVELAAMGDMEWAEGCRSAFCKYVAVVRQGPEEADKRYSEHKPGKLRPNSAEYWQKRGDHAVDIGHVFKYPYSYYDLLGRAADPALQQEWEAKEYLVF